MKARCFDCNREFETEEMSKINRFGEEVFTDYLCDDCAEKMSKYFSKHVDLRE